MAVEFRGVHALHVGHTGLVLAAMLDADGVFEDVHALGQVIEVEVRSRIAGRLVITETILILVSGKNVHGLGATTAMILQMDVLHIAVGAKFDPDDQFITHLDGSPNG